MTTQLTVQRMIRRVCNPASACIAAGLLACAIYTSIIGAQPACAELAADQDRPTFNEDDRRVIARNPSLAALVKSDPWTVRRFLDKLADTPDDDVSGAEDPDIDRMQRASPEAAHDLLQIIKEAGSGKVQN